MSQQQKPHQPHPEATKRIETDLAKATAGIEALALPSGLPPLPNGKTFTRENLLTWALNVAERITALKSKPARSDEPRSGGRDEFLNGAATSAP